MADVHMIDMNVEKYKKDPKLMEALVEKLKKTILKEGEKVVVTWEPSDRETRYMSNILVTHVRIDFKGLSTHHRTYLNFSNKDQYPMEAYSYETLLPALDAYQKKKKFQNPLLMPVFWGKFTYEDVDVAIMPAQEEKDYKIKNLHIDHRLQEDHTYHFVRQFASLHALSRSMEVEMPEEFKKLVKPLNDDYAKFLQEVDVAKETRKSINECYEACYRTYPVDASKEFMDFYLDKIAKSITVIAENKMDCLKTIVHGDFWVNQFMIYQSIKKPLADKLVGWRRPFVTSPFLDVTYFLFLAVPGTECKDVRREYLSEYITSFIDYSIELKTYLYDPDCVYQYPYTEDFGKFARLGAVNGLRVLCQCFFDPRGERTKMHKEYPLEKSCYKVKAEKVSYYLTCQQYLDVEFTIDEVEKYGNIKVPDDAHED